MTYVVWEGGAASATFAILWLAAPQMSGCMNTTDSTCTALPAWFPLTVPPHMLGPLCPPVPPPQPPDPRLSVLEGPVFRALVLRPDGSTDLDAFAALWPHLRVMARCTPADKFTLVQVRGWGC